MQNFKIFIIEDDTWYAELLEYNLALNPEYEIEKYTSGAEALKNLYKKPSVITLDYGLGDMNGEEVLKKIKEVYPELPVIIISAQEDIGIAVELLRKGAYDYIVKNEETKNRLWKIITNIRDYQELQEKHETLKKEVKTKYSAQSAIIGESQEIKQVFQMIERVKNANITVSITGETGTGKEMVAKAIHYNSNRAKQTFVAVNVSAIPEGLIESELFGYEKGAFTGANSRKIGKFELASNGTLFLDEIAEMDLIAQTKVLRVIQEQELTRLGGTQSIKLNTRLIIATHKNLSEEVKKGLFRKDLYYRIMGVPINLPPLRDRGADIIILAKTFIKNFCDENNQNQPKLSAEASKKLLQYHFPGNVRELKAIIELAIIMAENGTIKENHIIFSQNNNMDLLNSKEKTLEQYDQQIIRHFMEKYNNKAILVAEKLGVSKSTIYRLLKNMGYQF